MAYDANKYPDEIHLYAASLDQPMDFSPEFHVHYEERLSWLAIDDALPKHEGSLD